MLQRGSSVYLFAASAALNSANLGFDIGISSDVGLEVQEMMVLDDFQTEIFMGSINFFAIAGSFAASFLADWLGRRRAFAIAALGFLVGVSLTALAQSYAFLMIGRAIVGVGVGFGLAVDPVYIAEISPPSERGRLVTWSEIVCARLDHTRAVRFMFPSGSCLSKLVALLRASDTAGDQHRHPRRLHQRLCLLRS